MRFQRYSQPLPKTLLTLQKQEIESAKQKQGEAIAITWEPYPNSPQLAAYNSLADELFYGGAAGGGKSDLILGLAGTKHRTSILFRRVFPNTSALIERGKEIYGNGYNEAKHFWRLGDRLIEVGAVQYEKDWTNFRGRPHDLYAFDEITEFTEKQYRFITAWNRSTVLGQRCRCVCTGNPPTQSEGIWVLDYWGAWLNPRHPNPATPGELVWYARINDKDIEIARGNDRPEPIFLEKENRYVRPRSRTFIPAKLEDNPILFASGYGDVLDALPEPLRSQMRLGIFGLDTEDNPWQVIPTAWLDAAIARWKQISLEEILKVKMVNSLGVDVSRGGKDESVISERYGNYFAELKVFEGSRIKTGEDLATIVRPLTHAKAVVNIDVIGVGSSPYDILKLSCPCRPVNFGSGSDMLDKSGLLKMANQRAEAFWGLREALDPETGLDLAIPDDPMLRQELLAHTWLLRGDRIQIAPKEDVKELIARSPNRADALVLALMGRGQAIAHTPIKSARAASDLFEGY